jgi:hypothetical protein
VAGQPDGESQALGGERALQLSGRPQQFRLNEFASGLGRFGGAANQQILVQGNADRPMVAGDFNFSAQPTSRLTVVNNTSVNNLRINGPSSYTEINNGSNSGQTIYFRYLGIRTVTNSTDANYRVKDWIGFYAGYRYTDRLVRTIEGFSLPAFANSAPNDVYENTNHLHSGTVGVQLRPVKNLTANLEGEVGRADNPLTPVSDRNYHTLNGRVSYRTRKVQLSTSYKQVYNVNAPVVLSAYSSHSRNYSASASWAPKDWFALDAGYMKLHLDTVSGIAYFAGTRTLQEGNSLYLSNVHAANFGARFAVAKRADVYVGYTITKDTGDGRNGRRRRRTRRRRFWPACRRSRWRTNRRWGGCRCGSLRSCAGTRDGSFITTTRSSGAGVLSELSRAHGVYQRKLGVLA